MYLKLLIYRKHCGMEGCIALQGMGRSPWIDWPIFNTIPLHRVSSTLTHRIDFYPYSQNIRTWVPQMSSIPFNEPILCNTLINLRYLGTSENHESSSHAGKCLGCGRFIHSSPIGRHQSRGSGESAGLRIHYTMPINLDSYAIVSK